MGLSQATVSRLIRNDQKRNGDGKTVVQIALFTRIAQSVVRRYIELIDEYEITETRLSQLRRDRPVKRRQNGPAQQKGRRHGQTRRGKV